MSLVLSWENPPGLIDLNVRSVTIRRLDSTSAASVLVTADACWGMEVDNGNSDPSARYEIEYLTSQGAINAHLPDDQIQRWVRPPMSCIITWDLVKPDGSPDANRIIEISDKHITGNYIRRFTTNHAGRARFVSRFGQRLTYFLEGDLLELDAVAPKLQDITGEALKAFGSQVVRDRRAWF